MNNPKRRGAPTATKFNERLSSAEFEQSNAGLPEHLHGDRGGLDFTIAPPPWNDDQRQQIKENLTRLRLDPKSTNPAAHSHFHFAAALLEYPDESAQHHIAQDMAELLSENRAQVIESFLAEIVKMAKRRDDAAHSNFHALQAYYDFLETNGFNPTHRRLADFISDNPKKYPVGTVEKWWDLFFEAGLSRLAEVRGN